MLRRALLIGVVGLAAAALSSGVAADQKHRTVQGKAQLGYFDLVSPPETTCVGGQLTQGTCSASTKWILGRLEVQTWEPVYLSHSVKKLLNGDITFVVNCDFNAEYRGPCWGTFEWDVPGVGKWQGYWKAPVMDLLTYESRLSMVGVGQGGMIEGKQLKFDGGSAAGEYYITGSVGIH
jgi:hypothetical protein